MKYSKPSIFHPSTKRLSKGDVKGIDMVKCDTEHVSADVVYEKSHLVPSNIVVTAANVEISLPAASDKNDGAKIEVIVDGTADGTCDVVDPSGNIATSLAEGIHVVISDGSSWTAY